MGTRGWPFVSADEAVGSVQSGDRVFVQGANAFPQVLVDALTRRGELDAREPLRNVEIVHLHTAGSAPYVSERFAGVFHHRALFVGANTREAIGAGRASYVPVFLSDVPDLFRSGRLPIEVVLLHLSPPDEHGYCSLGTSVDCALAAAQVAPVRIAQINPRMPRTLGDSFIHMSQLTHMVEVDEPLPEHRSPPPDEIQLAIGRHLAGLIPDGATLQLGIGGIPDAVLCALRDRKDLGIHSEVVSDGIVDLVERGVITGTRKTVNRGKIVVAFLNGTQRLYDFVHDNPMVEMRPVDYTNDTRVILRQDNMIAINSALEIDLTGQVCAESIGHRVYSGVGGQMDFLRGAALSHGGKPIIALASTAKGGSISRIVPTLQPGAGITTSRAHAHYVATEYGVVNLHGLDLAERAHALIGLAHPAFREGLEHAARELCLLR
ncbi:MAG TPA: acetyl-CoA hydrolase/transferase C-terminal domain-containing protein [Chloroflexota bacterium]